MYNVYYVYIVIIILTFRISFVRLAGVLGHSLAGEIEHIHPIGPPFRRRASLPSAECLTIKTTSGYFLSNIPKLHCRHSNQTISKIVNVNNSASLLETFNFSKNAYGYPCYIGAYYIIFPTRREINLQLTSAFSCLVKFASHRLHACF